MAKRKCDQLHNIFSSPGVSMSTKINIYKSVVISLLIYDCEVWDLTTELQVYINGTNAICLARITGRSIHFEVSALTQTFHIIITIHI